MLQHRASNNARRDEGEQSHMDSVTQTSLLRPARAYLVSNATYFRSYSSESSGSSIASTASDSVKGLSCTENFPSLLSTSFGDTPCLSLDYVGSTETLNYDGTRRMSIPVIPVEDTVEAKRHGDIIATKQELDGLTTAHPLPELASGKWRKRWRTFRYGTMSAYMRLWHLAIIVNLAIIIALVSKVLLRPGTVTYGTAATATGANLLIAALMRHEHCINLLFRMATALPYRTPLAIRRQAAKVYSYGGVHAGCGISALLWYIFYCGLAVAQFKGSQAETIAVSATTALTLLCLCIIIGMAHPKIRTRWHDQWEMSHRFAGWTAIGLVWAQTIVVAIAAAHHAHESIGKALLKTPTFWFLIVISCCLVYPWLRLRKRPIKAEVLSSHAVRLWFDDKTLPSCVGARLSTNPLTENHGFATIPNPRGGADIESGISSPKKAYLRSLSPSSNSKSPASITDQEKHPSPNEGKGFSILVSRAGDFTSSLIESPPTAIYTRGAPTKGVLHIAHLFRPIILIATGSGIGPCLSFLNVHPAYPVRVIWSARSPLTTYGQRVVDEVRRADAEAVVIDTQVVRKVDLTRVAWALKREVGAEAVMIISNPVTTRRVVFELECRGVPAFGAIFDS